MNQKRKERKDEGNIGSKRKEEKGEEKGAEKKAKKREVKRKGTGKERKRVKENVDRFHLNGGTLRDRLSKTSL